MAEATNDEESGMPDSPDTELPASTDTQADEPPLDGEVVLEEEVASGLIIPSDAAGIISLLKNITLPMWIGIATVLVVMVIVIGRCAGGDDGGTVYLAVSDDRGNVHITPAIPTELDSEQRIGRLSELAGGDSPLIAVYKKNKSGLPEFIHTAPLVMTSNGQRLTVYSARASATTIERSPVAAPLGDGIELTTGEVAEVLYYLDDDIVYFEEHSGNNRACYVSQSGNEPTRIAIGKSCGILFADELVEVRTDRKLTFYDYDGDERLELDVARFVDVDFATIADGESLVATLRAESGLTELIIGQFDGEQQFITANDHVQLRAHSPRADWFMYSESGFSEADELYLVNAEDEVFVGEGEVHIASVSPDGSRAIAGIINQSGRFELWEADLEADTVAFDLVYDLYSGDLANVEAVWLDASPAQLLVVVSSFNESDSFAELRTGDESVELTVSSLDGGGYGILPLGDSWLWLSAQRSDTGDHYTIVELVRGDSVVANDDLDGTARSLVVLDDDTVAAALNRSGSVFLTNISVDGDDFEITDLTASDWIGDLYAGGGRLYARSQSDSGFAEILTASADDDVADSLSGEITQVIALLDQQMDHYSSSR